MLQETLSNIYLLLQDIYDVTKEGFKDTDASLESITAELGDSVDLLSQVKNNTAGSLVVESEIYSSLQNGFSTVNDIDTRLDVLNTTVSNLGSYLIDSFGQPATPNFYSLADQTLSQTVNTVDRLNRINDKLLDLEVKVTNSVVVTNDLLHPALNVVFEV